MESFSGRSRHTVPARDSVATQTATESRPVERTPSAENTTSSRRKRSSAPVSRLVWGIGLLVALLALAAVVWWLWRGVASVPGVDTSRYQAVWLTDKSLYFGKLQAVDGEYYRLTEVFYTQVAQATEQKDAASSPNVQLVKLGNELPYAEDTIMIPKKQILFYENLKADSKVAQAIQEYASKHK